MHQDRNSHKFGKDKDNYDEIETYFEETDQQILNFYDQFRTVLLISKLIQ